MPGFYSRKLRSSDAFSRKHSTSCICLHQEGKSKSYFHNELISSDSLLVNQKSINYSGSSRSIISDFSEVTITSNGNDRHTPVRRFSRLWRKSLLSSMNSVPDPDQEYMYLCSSKKMINSGSHETTKRSIRDEYSSYRRRRSPCSSEPSLNRMNIRVSYSEPSFERKTCNSKFTSESNNQPGSFSSRKIETRAGIDLNSDWGYFADCQHEDNTDVFSSINSTHQITPEQRQIFKI